MKKIGFVLFAITGAIELVNGITNLGSVHFASKMLLIPSLMVFYYATMKAENKAISPLLLLTLFLTWVGDVILMFPGDNVFMFGLIAFLLGHVSYIFVYRQHRSEGNIKELQGVQRIRFAFPIVLAGSGLVVILYPHLGALQIPVMIYALVITIMTINALFRYGRTNAKSFAMVFGGAILFMMSDSILAISKFIEPIELGGFWIMLTYIGAQFFIVMGLIEHQRK